LVRVTLLMLKERYGLFLVSIGEDEDVNLVKVQLQIFIPILQEFDPPERHRLVSL